MIIKPQLKIGYEKTHNTLLFFNIHKKISIQRFMG